MPKLALAMALLLPLCAAGEARAAGSGGSQNRDDLTVCCAGFFTPPPRLLAQLFVPQVVGCTAIDGDFKSINNCPGVVLGCDENAFLCEPSTSNAGTKDCLCAQFGQITPAPPATN